MASFRCPVKYNTDFKLHPEKISKVITNERTKGINVATVYSSSAGSFQDCEGEGSGADSLVAANNSAASGEEIAHRHLDTKREIEKASEQARKESERHATFLVRRKAIIIPLDSIALGDHPTR